MRSVDCDPKQAAEAAGGLFALNAGIAAFQARCAGGDKLNGLNTTDALLGFGRNCLQESRLIGKDSAESGARLAAIEMNRDDKAHRFVVTWNAFLDGNRLAYLALVLAIGVDSLVFMPLQDVSVERDALAGIERAAGQNAGRGIPGFIQQHRER